MFKITAGDAELWSPIRDELKLGSPTLSLQLNTVGSLSFKLYPDHKYYNDLIKMKTLISVYQDERILFKGRILSDTSDFRKVKTVKTEGILGYLNDSTVRPYDYSGPVVNYFQMLIKQHNDQVEPSQRFLLGNITIEDPNDYIVRASSNYPTTWKEITDKCINLLGGYVMIRYESDGNYIDYLKDLNDTATQSIAFGVNLLDLSKEIQGDKLATCIIPQGATIQNEDGSSDNKRVDITSVNNGVDYIYDADAVDKYGRIYEVVTWDDVTEPSNLLKKAKVYLETTVKLTQILKLKAVNLHLSDETIESFKLGDNIALISGPHNINDRILLSAYKLDLSNPQSCTIEADITKLSLTDTQVRNDLNNIQTINKIQDNVNKTNIETLKKLEGLKQDIDQNEVNYKETLKSYYTAKETDSAIQASSEKITSGMSTTYYTKTEVADELNKKLETYSTTDEVNSMITQQSDKISSELSKTYTTKEELSGLSIGVRNLLKNSKTLTVGAPWCFGQYLTDASGKVLITATNAKLIG